MVNSLAGFSESPVFNRVQRWTMRDMSYQGERPTDHEDDWWGQLYDDSTGDTGPTAAADSLDDLSRSKIRFGAVSCGGVVRSGGALVLVDQSSEDGLSSDRVSLEVGDGGRGGWFGAVWG